MRIGPPVLLQFCLYVVLALNSAAAQIDFEQLFPESLRDFQGCASIRENPAERGICELLAATHKQIDLLSNRRSSNTTINKPHRFPSGRCKYQEENGPSMHRYATERSPALNKLLDSYAQMHKLCMEIDYSQLHDHQYRPVCRYVTWHCTFGLGNRLMSLVSAFLYAVLSQRVLLVDNPGWEKLFCEPFPGSSWQVPSDLNLRYDGSFKSSFFTYYQTVSCSDSNSSCTKSLRGAQQVPRVVPVVFTSSTSEAEHAFLLCPSALNSVRNVPFINMKNSNQYFAPGFFLNPVLRPVLEALFPYRRVFHDLGRFLLHPSNLVWTNILQIHAATLANARRSIGVQIRHFQTGYIAYFDKTVPICIEHKTGICPIEAEEQPEDQQGVLAVYVASMVAGHADKINESLSRTGLRYKLGHLQADGMQLDDADHEQKALTEIWILSLTDVLLTSGMSTFGYTAQALGGITPYRITHWPKDPCLVSVSSDPCFHFAPRKGFKCTDDGFQIGKDSSRGLTYFWPCPDFATTGLQISEP